MQTLRGHRNKVRSIIFSSDGQFLVSGSDDSTVKLWDFQTGKYLHTLKKHNNTVTSVIFTPDSQTLMSGSEDGTIKFWQVQRGKCSKNFRIPNSYTNMNITGNQGLTEGQKENLKALGAVED